MADTLRLIPQLIELGVDVIDTSSGGNSSSQQLPTPLKPGYQVPFSEAIKKSKFGTKIMTAPVGLIVEAKQANEVIEQGQGDLVLTAREYLRDPHFPLKAAKELGVKELAWAPQYQRAKQ
jgi:2,4-dienoyl-CoA reductase-like NADH-dependent reductase (Old Yellow Enzyme family)